MRRSCFPELGPCNIHSINDPTEHAVLAVQVGARLQCCMEQIQEKVSEHFEHPAFMQIKNCEAFVSCHKAKHMIFGTSRLPGHKTHISGHGALAVQKSNALRRSPLLQIASQALPLLAMLRIPGAVCFRFLATQRQRTRKDWWCVDAGGTNFHQGRLGRTRTPRQYHHLISSVDTRFCVNTNHVAD